MVFINSLKMQGARKFFVGGNWKSNGTAASTRELIESTLNSIIINFDAVEVIVAPLSIHIPLVQSLLKPEISISAQNSSLTAPGAFTGEIAPSQLKDLGVNWTIIGHSERRNLYNENDEIVQKKVANAQNAGLSVIACIGENLQERDSGVTFDVVTKQLVALKEGVLDWASIVVAYEPVWAIGTGKVASPEQAQEVHAMIRQWLGNNVSAEVAQRTQVIYGGSVTDANCAALIALEDVDGFLVGGASLKPAFKVICESCNSAKGN